MFFHIDAASGIPIYVQLKGQFKNCIAGGILLPGDKLPPVRELAAQLTVNPNTIQKAYQELEQEGIIETLRGRGTFVSTRTSPNPDQDRESKMGELLKSVITEAWHLNYTKDELLRTFEQKLAEWDTFKGGKKDE